MEEEHRRAIQYNFTSLVEQTDLDMMVSALYEKGVFSEQMIEPYKDISRDSRDRKRQLYRDLSRRGPQAFGHLLDTLSEAGYWDIVRDLDPNSALHFRQRHPLPNTSTYSNENNFVSLSAQKKKTKSGIEMTKMPREICAVTMPTQSVYQELPDPSEIPQFHVVKSTKFYEENGNDIKLYRTRGRNRGFLVVFSYIEFEHDSEKYRYGVDVDCKNLKYLFTELGFKVLSYQNLNRDRTLDTLKYLKKVVVGGECVFIVVSSHGSPQGSDIGIRCHDGKFISILEIVNQFNNKTFPALKGVPKVFIFQLCRGSNEDVLPLTSAGTEADGTPAPASCPRLLSPPRAFDRVSSDILVAHSTTPGEALSPAPASPPRLLPPPRAFDRVTSDILVAHSTTPGSVSYRDTLEGSWYIQALCSVFAARAHDCHVVELFTLVDRELHDRFHVQTSAVENWGFNCRLYLHPGLYDDDQDRS